MKQLKHRLVFHYCRGRDLLAQHGKPLFLLVAMLAAFNTAHAQGGTLGGLSTMSDTIVDIVNIIFIVVIVLGLIRVIIKVVKSEPNWGGSVVGLLIALILWGGFNTYKDDIFSWFGGGQVLNPAGG